MKIVSVVLIPTLFAATVAMAQPAGTFTATGSMITPRFGHMATLLPNGKVLIAGGLTVCFLLAQPCIGPNGAELYDPTTGAFTATRTMNTTRPIGGVLLANGKVLFAEGYNLNGGLASVELYDPTNGVFNRAGNAATLANLSTATLLNDGRVLLIGWSKAGGGAEIYDPVAETFSPVANWPGQELWSPLVLTGGAVLLVSGESDSEIYDPTTDTFRPTTSLGYFDEVPPTTLLLNGKVLFTGGNTDSGNDSRAELYDPATGTFAATGGLSTARNGHSATLLPDGTVLIAGGAGQSGSSQPPLGSAEIYDPDTSGFSTTGSLTSARYSHTATLLNSGQVLVTGGTATAGGSQTSFGDSITAIASAELYTPAVSVPAPALLSLSGDGKGQGAIWDAQTGQIASANNPAVAGEALSMYTTSMSDGGVIPPKVSVGGRLAEILYFGAAPGYPGYSQVNFRLPNGVASGPAVSVHLTYLGRPSNEVTIAVQ